MNQCKHQHVALPALFFCFPRPSCTKGGVGSFWKCDTFGLRRLCQDAAAKAKDCDDVKQEEPVAPKALKFFHRRETPTRCFRFQNDFRKKSLQRKRLRRRSLKRRSPKISTSLASLCASWPHLQIQEAKEEAKEETP